MRLSTSDRGIWPFTGAAASVLLAATTAIAEPPLDPPRQYQVRGDGYLMVSGPNCCGDTRFSGQFQAAYQITSAGAATLTSMRFVLDDAEVDVRGGFLGLFSETIRLRCASIGSKQPAAGWVAGDELHFPAGAVRIAGLSAEERLGSGACALPTLALEEATNAALVKLGHDPAANRVALDGTFSGVWLEGEDDPYDFTLHASGRFDNRPPVASVGFETVEVPQGACPAVWLPNGGWVAEANDPRGLVGTLRSDAADPDGPLGTWSRADLLSERWLHSRSGGPRQLVGLGYRTDPVAFEWGPLHRVELVAMDLSGAAAAAQCDFRVVDRRAPVVTPPPATTIACSQAGGASPGTSAALRAFLEAAAASDRADPAPVRLAPRVGSTDVGAATLFPADGLPRRVTFRFRDWWGNVGTAASDLTVRDMPPQVFVTVTPSALPDDDRWHPILATVTVLDDCGGPVVLKLHKIISNSPAHDATDVRDATFGTDDRSFSLFARRPFGLTGPRVFRVWYRGTDAAGNTKLAFADVSVY